jgi:hypothetical protein
MGAGEIRPSGLTMHLGGPCQYLRSLLLSIPHLCSSTPCRNTQARQRSCRFLPKQPHLSNPRYLPHWRGGQWHRKNLEISCCSTENITHRTHKKYYTPNALQQYISFEGVLRFDERRVQLTCRGARRGAGCGNCRGS